MSESSPRVSRLSCLCASFRRASRALTQLYDEALRPSGLRTTQFTILQVLASVEEVTRGQLAKILAMDSTTLTRTLQIMARRRWIAERPGRDRRERWLRLARAGRLRLKRALPDWEKVQTQLRARLGEERWPAILELTGEMTSLVTKYGCRRGQR